MPGTRTFALPRPTAAVCGSDATRSDGTPAAREALEPREATPIAATARRDRGLARHLGRVFAGWLLCVFVVPTQAISPTFSHMTLNDLSALAISIEDVDRDLAVYGFTADKLHEFVRGQLAAGGITIVDYPTVLTMPHAGLFRVRILTNHDAQGFYHLSVKCELRQKIPLNNSAQGFVSQAVWSDARNGIMLASEVEKIEPLVRELLAGFLEEYRAQNQR